MYKLLAFLVCAVISDSIITVKADTLAVVTEESSLQYSENGKVVGIATELVKAVLAEAQLEGEFRIYPWPRAYEIAQTQPNTLIYSMTRSPKREKEFKWVGEILPLNYYFYRLKTNTSVNPRTLEEARNVRIGVAKNGVIHQYLKQKRFRNIRTVANSTTYLKMFMTGRIDFIVLNSSSLQSWCKNTVLDCKLVEPVLPIDDMSTGLYMALSQQTEDSVHLRLKDAYQSVREQGIYHKIMASRLQPKTTETTEKGE